MDPRELPGHLAERVRVSVPAGGEAGGDELVVYWMHHGVRVEENPALDVAHAVAVRLGLPLLVYQGLGGGHRHDSDRHHTFILEGARDVADALAREGTRHVFHLGNDRQAPSPLRALARRAAIVVTEDFPVPPFPRWSRALADTGGCPVWRVDTACVVPMQGVGRAFDRAFAFRRAIAAELDSRLGAGWPGRPDRAAPFEGDPGFEPVALANSDIAALCAASPIDHSVGPVPGTVGGTAAGFARWDAFRQAGLASYDRMRNDAAVAPPRGVSRLSPYLHHGHVPPTRIAREASRDGSPGAKKFIDELVVWRELAHNFCFHNEARLERDGYLALLPAWAQDTLREHAGDPREAIASLETLARGRTGDALWDACARALLVHGALHNNLRMTWGKAIAGWTASPERALELMFHLNDHHALDGSDPNSFAGLLYCLGLFDRPFEPPRPVLGRVRGRSTRDHARRLDLESFTRHAVDRPQAPSVAVVGAGIAGLAAARTLADQGFRVQLFERSRGVGGRAATRRRDGAHFDHGAQYFTARDPVFRRHVASWIDDGVAVPWDGRFVRLDAQRARHPVDGGPRYVGVPGMSAIGRHLSTDLAIVHEAEIVSLERSGSHWRLATDGGEVHDAFDGLVVATAPEQALRVLGADDALRARVSRCRSLPCWAALATFGRPLGLDFDGAFVDDDVLAWVARDSSKPGRPAGERWVLHATPQWSAAREQCDAETAAGQLLDAFAAIVDRDVAGASLVQAHRWRFARVADGAGEDCLFDGARAIAVCGDWCPGARVEGAFVSGIAAAGRIAGLLRGNPPVPAS